MLDLLVKVMNEALTELSAHATDAAEQHSTFPMKIHPLFALSSLGVTLLLSARGAVIVPTDWKQSNAFNSLRLASNLSNATGMDSGQTTLFNHDGSPSGEPNNANNSQWTTSAKTTGGGAAGIAAEISEDRVWVVFDLGASYDLSTIRIWNLNWDNTPGSPASYLNNRGISQFDIYIRDTAADTHDGTVGGTAINVAQVSDGTNALSLASAFTLGSTDPWTLAISNQSLAVAPNNDTYSGQSFNLTGNTGRFLAIKADSYYGDIGGVGLGKVRIEGTLAVPEPAAVALGSLGLLALLRRRR